MQDERSRHDPELSGIEAQLAALAPVARIDRDQVMFAAGQRAASRRLRSANRLLAASSLLCASLAAVLLATPRGSNEPIATVAPASTGSADARQPKSTRGAASRLAGPSLATIDSPTSFRLLQSFAQGAQGSFDQPPSHGPTDQTGDEHLPPSDARTLLKRYLESRPGQL